MPTALPWAWTRGDDDGPWHPPEFLYGCLFHSTYEDFSLGGGRFSRNHIRDIKAHNPNLAVGKYSLAPRLKRLQCGNAYGQQLHGGQYDENGLI
ncbi:hypothetical protein SAPIO_CDS6966 [Scedosporium apiospermum]|uniref:Uncharacterized protein n=1 Tax=Pseudallescheria apiosperma TaxID=563466 RepID=A0A084G2T6_PSEDA|nr:uncharacterized protein SAPIO_CDS6966 [Scedosporium apiospermum]KEZ41648.1 hypothetical protein SAPIO_CDS6966 [Scedosporium apiospermum]